MVKVLVTGGAGFMGRWLVKHLVEKGHNVWVLDNFSNSSENNIAEFRSRLSGFVKGDIKNIKTLKKLFKNKFELCFHLAASINVQESIDNPGKCFEDNVTGTFNVLEECRKHKTKIVFVSSALVYTSAKRGELIMEAKLLNPSCPYVASKIFGEEMVAAYYKTYNLPMVILRPFSIYGPWQRSDSEGGVMSIFVNRKLKNQSLKVYGDGKQGRDFFYIEDCAEFIAKAGFSSKAVGQVFNAGSGVEIKIGDLAKIIANDKAKIKFVKHHHPYAEIMHMRADSSKALKLLGWKKRTSLKEGIRKTTDWLRMQEN
ncbi:MAG: NAD-dependent epimerase/dehydratase family protein [Candidatus Firestonebacteria bacterium]